MSRSARKKSSSGIYHIIVRGINRQDIFHEEEDYAKYLEVIKRAKDISKFEVYGYCLMSNHVHLLVCEKADSLDSIMKRIGVSYAGWYNRKQDRVGHLFQDRYKSEPVEDETYLLSVLRYIHNNPVKAKMVLKAEEYKWSSYKEYNTLANPDMIISRRLILGMFAECEEVALQRWREFEKKDNNEKFLDVEAMQQKISDECLYQEIQSILNGQSVGVLQSMEKSNRNKIIRQIKDIAGATHRQIARVAGINQSLVFKA